MNRLNLKNKRTTFTLIGTVILFFAFWVFWLATEKDVDLGNNSNSDSVSVSLIDVLTLKANGSVITVNGQVESNNQASLSSEVGGVFQNVYVSIGQNVSKGQLLASFDDADIRLSLAEAEAGLVAQEVRLVEMKSGLQEGEIRKLESLVESAEIALEKVINDTQDNIESSRRNLLNNDLQVYLANERIFLNENQDITPPQISGVYGGDKEGRYSIQLYRSHAQSGYSFSYQGPDEIGFGSVNTRVPQPLGKNGLFIIFPENFADQHDIEWIVPIPNDRGVGYLSVKDVYQRALDGRDPAIRQAEENLKQRKEDLALARSGSRQEQIQAQEAQVRQAEARVAAARSQLNKRWIRAPFSGTVSKVYARVGESVNPGQSMFALVNKQLLRVNAKVSPAEARLLSVGDKGLVEGEYSATVSAISGVLDSQTGQVEVEITIEDLQNNLIVGEYVKANVFINSGSGSILLPLSAVQVSSAGNAVFTVEENRAKRVAVSLGSVEGEMINITAGLEDLDYVIRDASSVRSGQLVNVR